MTGLLGISKVKILVQKKNIEYNIRNFLYFVSPFKDFCTLYNMSSLSCLVGVCSKNYFSSIFSNILNKNSNDQAKYSILNLPSFIL